MRFLQRSVAILLITVFAFTSVAPALASVDQADTVQVTLQNKTGAAVRLTLTGPTTVSLNLATGKTKANMAVGTYKYSYEACGKTNTGTFKVKSNGDNLTLPKCKGGSGGTKTVTLVIHNKTDGTLYFVFTGPQSYRATVPPGKTKLTMAQGTYQYTISGNACGSYFSFSDTLKLKNSLVWTWYC